MTEGDFIEYLEAKRAIDDRSLNVPVARGFAECLSELRALKASEGSRPLILEAGAGTGTMAARLEAQGLLEGCAYLLLDSSPGLLAQAKLRLSASPAVPYSFAAEDVLVRARRCLEGGEVRADAFLAHALLDLLDLETALPLLRGCAVPGAPFWFSLVFDGLTAWEPRLGGGIDELVVAEYHASMDERRTEGLPAGGSSNGRLLLALLPAQGFEVIAAGASDWIVFPREGSYPPGEALFLDRILDFFAESLAGRPAIPASELAAWIALRRGQVRQGSAVFMARHIDILARSLGGP